MTVYRYLQDNALARALSQAFQRGLRREDMDADKYAEIVAQTLAHVCFQEGTIKTDFRACKSVKEAIADAYRSGHVASEVIPERLEDEGMDAWLDRFGAENDPARRGYKYAVSQFDVFEFAATGHVGTRIRIAQELGSAEFFGEVFLKAIPSPGDIIEYAPECLCKVIATKDGTVQAKRLASIRAPKLLRPLVEEQEIVGQELMPNERSNWDDFHLDLEKLRRIIDQNAQASRQAEDKRQGTQKVKRSRPGKKKANARKSR